MILLLRPERKMIKLAIFNILLGSVPQMFLAWQFIANGEIFDRMFFSPGMTLFVICIPGLLWKYITMRLAFSGMNKEDFNYYCEMWSDSEPLTMKFPLFQFHSGVFYLWKIAIIVVIRFILACKAIVKNEPTAGIQSIFRGNRTYLIINPLV